jgi:hypothetical protein
VNAAALAALLIVLTDTGARRDGFPVLTPAPHPEPHLQVLTHGFSGRLLRLYQLEQRFMHPNRGARPAYLVLSSNQGGFPRVGFYLNDTALTDTGYVDLHVRSTLTGRAGAMDQIFPHELMHLIVHDLAGEPADGNARQVHAVGVRTDRITAFDEGFAEHAQVMAIDDPDVSPDTRRVADPAARADAVRRFDEYARAMAARWSIAPKTRMQFPFWFSASEQVLRYHGVRENLYAFEPDIPDRLLTPSTAYDAYLLENVMPGDPRGPSRSAARMLATEGVVSALFARLASDPAIRQVYRDAAFYARFGVDKAEVPPADNAYLKLFAAIHEGGYDAAAVVRAYVRLFPDEAGAVTSIARRILNGQEPPDAPEIWLLNDRFQTGTTLFDQFRGQPRAHTFDLNASALADLLGVSGMTPASARAIRAHAPYHSVADVSRVDGVPPVVAAELSREQAAMTGQRAEENESQVSARAIITAYAVRALLAILIAASASALLYRVARRASWWRLALNGVAVALVGLLLAWTIEDSSGLLPFVAPVVMFGVPAALWRSIRARSVRAGLPVAAAWLLASLAPLLVVKPLG